MFQMIDKKLDEAEEVFETADEVFADAAKIMEFTVMIPLDEFLGIPIDWKKIKLEIQGEQRICERSWKYNAIS